MNKRTLALAGATVLCAGGVAFAAAASASTGDASPASVSSSQGSKDTPKSPDLSKVPRMLHSEGVTQDPKTGRLTTRDTQSGKVTSTSDAGLTVRSPDGTTWAWKLTKDTRFTTEKSGDAKASDIKSGDEVMVTGTRSGETRTARTVSDPPRTLAKGIRKKLRNRLGDLDQKQLQQLRKDLRKDLPQLRDRLGRPGSSGSASESGSDAVQS